MELIKSGRRDQFTRLRNYEYELLKSNPNSKVVVQCFESNVCHVFERIFICLMVYRNTFPHTCKSLVELEACFSKGDYMLFLKETTCCHY